MAFMAVLESDLRALSAEARRRYPAVKDGAEHAILKLRSLSSPSEIAHNEDILRIFLMACEVRTVKLSVIGLSCLQKLISHDAVAPSALKEILSTLKDYDEIHSINQEENKFLRNCPHPNLLVKARTAFAKIRGKLFTWSCLHHKPLTCLVDVEDFIYVRTLIKEPEVGHLTNQGAALSLKELLDIWLDDRHSEMNDETVQLKTLQTILIILQSQLHPENEENMAQVLGICLRLLESHRSSDNVRNTAAATFRQAVALIFDHVVAAESLRADKFGAGGHLVQTSSVTGDVGRSMNLSESLEHDFGSGGPSSKRKTLSKTGKLGLRLLEDLTALAAGGSAVWLHVGSLQRIFALEILEFILSNYAVVFKTLISYEQVLRHQICSLLMTSLRTNAELEGEAGEPSFRRLVLRSVAHIIRLYSSSLITECEVFLSMLVKVTFLDLPLWHRILVLEILRGFCVEARTLKTLFLNFDMNPKNTNVVEGMVKALARVVSSVQVQETSEESLAAVAGMFSSKAKGIEWSLDNDASNAAVLVASEAHAITLAIEGLLGVVFTVATLTDEAVDIGELDSPRSGYDPPLECTGKTALLCISMVDSLWLIVLDALSLILARSQGEAIVLEILKGYQAFTQACGVLRAVEPLNSFLASLCKFTIGFPVEADKKSNSSLHSPGSKRSESTVDQKDSIVLTPKNVQALRTLFNIAHRLHNVLGPSWVLVLETLAALDRAIHSPHAATQEVATTVPQLTRASSGLYSDFNILSSLNSQLFESSALMHISAVKSLLTALRQLSHQSITGMSSVFGAASSQKFGTISFSVERMMSILVNNLHRVQPIWDQVVGHFLELIDNSNQHVRNMALDALDRSISSVLGSDQFQESLSSGCGSWSQDIGALTTETGLLECAVISPLGVLYSSNQSIDVRATTLKILLHVLERYADKLRFSWPDILEMLRSVADASEKDLVTLGFQSLRVIMNDGLSTLPAEFLPVCIDVTGAYSAQKTELNISLTSIGLLWTAADFIARGLSQEPSEEKEREAGRGDVQYVPKSVDGEESLDETSVASGKANDEASTKSTEGRDKLLFSVFLLLQKLGADERPEVRNSAVRTLFQTLGSHGQKLSKSMWEDCLWNYVFPMLDQASHMAATSSKDEWRGKELGTRGGKAVHMLIHHSRNTAQKQWDETLVLVLNGISRILRSFFPFLRSLSNFWSGWESLLIVVRDSILNGSKEVALAAVSSLQMTVVSHSLKGNLPMPYLTSVLEVYEFVFQRSPSYGVNSTSKAKQEILHGLGELYVQSRSMFDSQMYTQLLAIIDLAIKQSMMGSENVETDIGNISPIQRTVLEILPLLRPTEQFSSWWLIFLREILHYLPHPDESLRNEEEEVKRTNAPDGNQETRSETPNGIASTSLSKAELDSPSSQSKPMCISSKVFPEKVIPVLVDLSLRAPTIEKHIILPEIVESLGRCMKSRRDDPYAGLWRTAVEGFNCIVLDDASRLKMNSGPDANISRQARVRFWKEVADVYEVFLVGCCGRALPTDYLPAAAVKADESLEMTVLNILGDNILKSPIDASADILQRLVSTLDRCASRTCTLPIDTVELMPPHSSRFSLTCLEKLFSLTSYDSEACNWNSITSDISKISVMILMARCEYILHRFLIDENDLGDRPLPTARLEEMIYILKQLARLVIHKETVCELPLHPHLRRGLGADDDYNRRAHLLVLFPSFCELVASRESRVRELVQVLLRLIAEELALGKFQALTGLTPL